MPSLIRPKESTNISEKCREHQPTFSIDALVTMIEGIRSSIHDIHGEVVQSRSIASETLNSYAETSQQIDGLNNSAESISKVIRLIDSVAARTNMLGLNASIEAAKAGESGKGFAVVAGEVKSLANQTSTATQTVRSSIDSLSASGLLVRSALETLKQSVEKLAGTSNMIESGTHKQKKILETLHEESLNLASQFKMQNNLRLENAAQNVVQLIVRNLYERTADVRWWATDPSLVEALGQDGTPEEKERRTKTASERLSLINRFYSVYRNLILLSKDGQVIACSNTQEFGHLVGNNLAKQDWFRNSIRTPSGDTYHAANIFVDPLHANQAVSIYGTAVRDGGRIDGSPIGALCVVFDWEKQASNVVCNESGLSKEDLASSRVLLLDKQLRIIGDSTGKPSLKRYPLKHQNQDRGTYTDMAGTEVSYARTLGYEEFDGLGYFGMIETPNRFSQKP